MSDTKRSYGTGSLLQKHGAWYGRWHLPDGRRVSRRLGPIRTPGEDDGLTRRDAEAQLRKLRLAEEQQPAPKAAVSRRTVDDAAEALRRKKAVQGVSRSYLATIESAQRRHFGPKLGRMPLRNVHRRDVEAMSEQLLEDGLAPKTVANTLKILHGVFEHAIDLEWTHDNPVRRAARPRHVRETDPDLRFLTVEELEAVLRAIPDELVVRQPKASRAGRAGPSPPPPPDVLGPVLKVLVLTAAMTGLRQGELLALRWRDVDWPIQRVRVRQTWRRTEFLRPRQVRPLHPPLRTAGRPRRRRARRLVQAIALHPRGRPRLRPPAARHAPRRGEGHEEVQAGLPRRGRQGRALP